MLRLTNFREQAIIMPQKFNVEDVKKEEIKELENKTNTYSVLTKQRLVSSSEVIAILEGKTETNTKSFQEIYDEMCANVPDRTSTIEEKEKALSYINQMLSSKDITPELKSYWENKKDVIQMEIQSIKNDEQAGKDTNYQSVADEYRKFIQQHWCDNYPQERNNNLEFLDSEEYNLTFYNTCMSYLNRILACDDLPENARNDFEQEINHYNAQKQSRLGEINWYKQNHDIKTESFENVFEEMRNNVPDRTSTIEEKKLASAYIKRMLTCDDIPDDLKIYWQNKKEIIEMEIIGIENSQKADNDEKVSDVWQEFSNFADKFKKDLDSNLSKEDRQEYGLTYHNTCISFHNRLLACDDLTPELKAEYQKSINMHESDISRIKGFFAYDYDYLSFKMDNPIIANSIEDLPAGSHETIRDARRYDISGLNLSLEELLNLCIDRTTKLSPEQQAIIDEYTEKMKDPGLGIRELHEQGITGKGVKIAIIDQPLGYHQEYGNNVVEHHDINCNEYFNGQVEASMHGAAVASIAVGENCGVAPEADLVYYSAWNMSEDPEDIEFYKSNILAEIERWKNNGWDTTELEQKLEQCEQKGRVSTNKPYVEAINKILDENEKLPPEERVTVISISWGFDELAPGYEELQEALQRAKGQGVFLISTRLGEQYGMYTCGANRDPQGDVNDPNNYEAGAFWKDNSEYMSQEFKDSFLLVPMDHRTVADFTDGSSYRYEGNDGGMSWSTPWLAGVYVLAKQVDFDITPEKFWELALATSDECRNNDTGEYVGRIINPQALIKAIQEQKEQ